MLQRQSSLSISFKIVTIKYEKLVIIYGIFQRSKDNIRKRPFSHKRHDPYEGNDEIRRSSNFFFNENNLEWLSINYRKFRAAQISKSNRRMVYLLFEEDYQFFPSLMEIRDGLISA